MGSPHTIHEWRERTEEDEIRFLRAWRSLGRWHFLSTLKSDPGWTPVPEPSREMLVALRQKLFDKYQRRRIPWEHVEEIGRMISALPPEPNHHDDPS